MASAEYVVDVSESNFQIGVIERSRSVPVVVDFWAPWCGPCRVLSPILTNLAQEYGGRFVLAKINVDENPRLAAQYGVQGIPMVKAFRDGQAVDEFVGAQPHPTVRQFIERLLPDPVEAEISAARTLLEEGRLVEAEAAFRQVLLKEPARPSALLGLAAALLRQGQAESALGAVDAIPPDTPAALDAQRLRREIQLRKEVGSDDENHLRARVEEAPEDLETRFRLAGLLTVQQCYEEALDHYLEIVRRNRGFRDGAARQAMLDIFEQLGDQAVVRAYRNKLAMVLFV